MELIENLEWLLKVFWLTAIIASIILGIQAILVFMGADIGDEVHALPDHELPEAHSWFCVFSLKSLILFLLVFSGSGIVLYTIIPNPVWLVIAALVAGGLLLYLLRCITKLVQKIAAKRSSKITNTINKIAEVYLSIPESKTGKGKIILLVNGSFHELNAMTEKNRCIPSGSFVKVIRIEDRDVLIVEKV
jgi:hypothetical protein